MPHYRQTIGGRYYKDLKNGNSVRVSEEEFNRNVRRVRGGSNNANNLGDLVEESNGLGGMVPVTNNNENPLYKLKKAGTNMINAEGNPVFGYKKPNGTFVVANPKVKPAATSSTAAAQAKQPPATAEANQPPATAQANPNTAINNPLKTAKNKAKAIIGLVNKSVKNPANTAKYQQIVLEAAKKANAAINRANSNKNINKIVANFHKNYPAFECVCSKKNTM